MLNSSYHRKNPFTSFLLQKELSSEICKHHQKCMDCENDKELCIPSIYKNSAYEMQIQACFQKCFIPHLSSIEEAFLQSSLQRGQGSFRHFRPFRPFLHCFGCLCGAKARLLGRALNFGALHCRNSERKVSEAHGILISTSQSTCVCNTT